MKTYTIEQIKKYILSQDSLGDVLYNLSEQNIEKVNNIIYSEDYIQNIVDVLNKEYAANFSFVDACGDGTYIIYMDNEIMYNSDEFFDDKEAIIDNFTEKYPFECLMFKYKEL